MYTITAETDHVCHRCTVCDEIFSDYDHVVEHLNNTTCDVDQYQDFDYVECFCWVDNQALISEGLANWAQAHPSPEDLYLLQGRSMGWRQLNGSNITELNYERPSDMFGVNSDYTQEWSFSENPEEQSFITIIQSHHDAPTGETYTIAALTPLQYIMYLATEAGYGDFDEIADEYSHVMEQMPHSYEESVQFPRFDTSTITESSTTYGSVTWYTAMVSYDGMDFRVTDDTPGNALARLHEGIDIINSYAETEVSS